MQSKAWAVYFIIAAILGCAAAQGEQPNGMSIVGTTNFPGLGTIRSIAFSNATGTDVYYIGADHVLYKVTGSITNVASRTTIWTGTAGTDNIVSIMVDTVTNNLFICTSVTRTVRRFNLLNDLAANVRLVTPGSSSTAPWLSCVLDTPGTGSPGGIIWIAGSNLVVSLQTIYGTAAGSGVYKALAVSSSTLISTVVVDDTSVYWGAGAGRVIKTAKTNRNLVSTSVSFKVLSIGSVLSSAYNPNNGLLYFSSDTSLVSEIKASTFGFTRIYPENNVQFPVMALDTTNNAMVLAAYDPSVTTLYFYRVSLSGDQMERYATVTAGSFAVNSVYIDSTNRMMYWGSASGNLVGLRVANCARSCLDCSGDPDYCGFCLSSRTCTGSDTCSVSNWRRVGNYECPLLTTVTPSSGSTAGGTSVKIGGSFLLDGLVIDSNAVNCVVDGKSVASTSVTFSEVSCQTPTRTQSSATATVDAYVTWNSVPWTDNVVPFQYYRCESYGSDCATCFANPECGLCGATGTCTASRSCAQGWSTVCPTITSFSPSSSSILGGVTITVTVSPSIVTSVSYRCLFGTIAVNANVVSSTQLTCVSPSLSPGQWTTLSNGDAEVAVTLSVQPTSGSAQPISTVRRQDFLFYDCPSYESDCARCVDQFETVKRKPECTFCFNTQTCGYTSQIAASCNTTGSCPFITGANPDTMHTSEVQSAGVTTVLSFSGAVGTVKCAWDTGSVNLIESGVTATSQLLSAGKLQCTIPTGPSVGDHTVSLWTAVNATFFRRVTPNLTFKIYDCEMSACELCYDATTRPKCSWCHEDLTCQLNSVACTTEITNVATCPSILSLSIDHDAIQGGTTVDVIQDYSLAAFSSVDCNFNGQLATASLVNDTLVQCTVPAAAQAGQVSLTLESEGVPITRASTFAYYDCSLVTGGCENCITNYTSRCGWCGASCGFGNCTDSDLPVDEVCPSITEISPTVGYVDGGDAVIVRGGPFYLRQGYIYTCLFGNNIVPAEVVLDPINGADLVVQCLTPGGGFGTVSFKVFVNGIRVHPSASLSFTFFTCDSFNDDSCSDLCTAQQYCGWCVESSACLPASRCVDKLFLNECLSVQFLPPHVELSQPAQTIDITFSPSLNFNTTGLNTNATNSKRLIEAESGSLVPSPVECDWVGYLKTAAYIRDESTLFCSTPSIVKETGAVLQVLYNGVLLVPTIEYNFVSCDEVEACGECSKKQLCGWCLEDNSCSVNFLCTSQWVSQDCPTMETIDPSVISEAGGVNLTITGRYFLDNPGTLVAFGSNATLSPAEVNDSKIVVVAPAGVAGKNVDVRVLYYGKTYAVNSLIIGYTNDGSLTQQQVAGLSAGIVIGGVVLAGVAAFLVIYLRRKAKKNRKGLFIEIKEPDYEKVAYLEDLNAQWRVTADDGYKFLEDVVMSRDRTFVQALAKVTTATELDVIGRSLIYVSHANGRSAEMLQFFCNETVRAAASENTIFRADNLATKMFKFYSKLVGSRYLYYTLVKLILELNTVAEDERKRQADRKELTLEVENSVSILNIEMEVDPTHLDPTKNIDTDASSLQLALFCQKVFTAIRTNTDRVPPELRNVFMKLDDIINERFGSQDAVYKAIGGMMFLRFICNGITNPHYYGLLEGPPNPIAQRQLILIAKLLQALANMSQRRENKFMETMFEFIDKNVQKMKELYDDVLKPPNDRSLNEKMQMDLKVPEQVRLNSLANMHELINRTQAKLRKIFEDIDDEDKSRAMIDTLDAIVSRYGETPEKIKRQESKKKMKKPNSKTELLSAPSSSSVKKAPTSKTELIGGPNSSSTN